MERMNFIYIVTALVLCLQFNDVEGIYCFQCNSWKDEGCFHIKPNDTMSEFYRECRMNPEQNYTFFPQPIEFFCRKIVQRVHDRDGLLRVVRKCGWVPHKDLDCYRDRSMGHEDMVCQCFVDGCNSAVKIKGYATTIFASFFVLIVSLKPNIFS